VFDIEKPPSSGSGMGLSTAVLIGAVIAMLVAVVYLFVQVNNVQTDLANLRDRSRKTSRSCARILRPARSARAAPWMP